MTQIDLFSIDYRHKLLCKKNITQYVIPAQAGIHIIEIISGYLLSQV